jgi:cystathionine gamma-synthase
MYSNPRTLAVSTGRPEGPGAALNEGMHPASNFILGGDRAYSRDAGTPTWVAFEQIVGALEHGDAVSFASGMAAIAAVIDLVPVGGQIVWPDDCYQGVAGLITAGERAGRWTTTRLPAEATDDWCDAARTADLIWVESPSNPMLEVIDLGLVCARVHTDGFVRVAGHPGPTVRLLRQLPDADHAPGNRRTPGKSPRTVARRSCFSGGSRRARGQQRSVVGPERDS